MVDKVPQSAQSSASHQITTQNTKIDNNSQAANNSQFHQSEMTNQHLSNTPIMQTTLHQKNVPQYQFKLCFKNLYCRLVKVPVTSPKLLDHLYKHVMSVFCRHLKPNDKIVLFLDDGKDYIYIENDTDLFDACQDLNLKRILILNDFDQLEKYGQPVQMRINDSFRAEHITEIIKAISTKIKHPTRRTNQHGDDDESSTSDENSESESDSEEEIEPVADASKNQKRPTTTEGNTEAPAPSNPVQATPNGQNQQPVHVLKPIQNGANSPVSGNNVQQNGMHQHSIQTPAQQHQQFQQATMQHVQPQQQMMQQNLSQQHMMPQTLSQTQSMPPQANNTTQMSGQQQITAPNNQGAQFLPQNQMNLAPNMSQSLPLDQSSQHSQPKVATQHSPQQLKAIADANAKFSDLNKSDGRYATGSAYSMQKDAISLDDLGNKKNNKSNPTSTGHDYDGDLPPTYEQLAAINPGVAEQLRGQNSTGSIKSTIPQQQTAMGNPNPSNMMGMPSLPQQNMHGMMNPHQNPYLHPNQGANALNPGNFDNISSHQQQMPPMNINQLPHPTEFQRVLPNSGANYFNV